MTLHAAGTLAPPSAAPALRDAPGAAPRHGWIDAARGVGIVLVVFGHAVHGLVAAGLASASGWAALAHEVFYTFRMPLFFLIAGVFVSARVARHAGAFRRDVVHRIGWPYLLWSTVQLVVIAALGTRVNLPAAFDLADLPRLLWAPVAQFWYLHTMLLLHLIASVVLPRAGVLALLLPAAAAWPLAALFATDSAAANLCRFAVFYAAGVAAGPALAAVPARLARAAGVAGALVWLVAVVWAGARAGTSPQALVAGFAGAAMCIGFAAGTALGRIGALRWIGQRSLSIYVLHIFFVAGTRIVLAPFVAAMPLLALATLAGVAGPLLVLVVLQRWGVAPWLGLR